MKRIICLLLAAFGLLPCFAGTMNVLGVRLDSEGLPGIIAILELELINGSGRVFFNTHPLAETDTQSGARMAVDAACVFLDADCSKNDFLFTINANTPMIGGPSAGAAMAVLAMAELSGTNLSKDYALTGTINPDGTIGVVGGVLEKILACNEKGINALIPKGTAYLLENASLSINAIEVSTIDEAFAYFANLPLPQMDSEINASIFNKFMKIMSEDLMENAFNEYNVFLEKNESANLSEIDSLQINSLAESLQKDMDDINGLYDSKAYYSASSYSVRMGINAVYGQYLIDYFMNESNVDSIIIQMNDSLIDFSKNYDGFLIVDNINDFEAISISIERFFEAKSLLESAIESNEENDSFGALYNLAFANIRLKTSVSWLGLKDLLIGDLMHEFNQDSFEQLAYSWIENSKKLLDYAESMQESYYTLEARKAIDKSSDAYNQGYYTYSLFESIKSISNSNLAMSLPGISDENIDSRILLMKELAGASINRAESREVIPILAYSYYEYGVNFEESEKLQAILFFEYSKQFSLLSEQLANEAIPKKIIEDEESFNFVAYLPKIAPSILFGILAALIVLEAYYETKLLNKKRR